jgi:SAM-dependent methyltransferase
MERMKLSRVMDNVAAYRLWQAPFAEKKLRPLKRYNNLSQVKRVLDVGCGPGTNASHFCHCEYLGVDWNESYISYARQRYGRQFLAIDVCNYDPPGGGKYDFILVNSFLHHIDDANTLRILRNLKNLLTGDGHIHILDLVMPEDLTLARCLAQWDRGCFARPLSEWRRMFSGVFIEELLEPYSLTCFGVTLWNMVYFKGKTT